MSGPAKNVSSDHLSPYRRNGNIVVRKFREFIPALLIANISNMILLTVNGLVVGNFYGSDGFACISFVDPIESLINVGSTLTACGIATYLSTAMGSGDTGSFEEAKGVSMQLMFILAVLFTVIELPLAWMVIRSYDLSPYMYSMTWKYALIRILTSPVEILTTVFVYELQIVGKMRALMWQAIVQGVSNILFDLLFVAYLHMGIAGAGYGTACSMLLRAVLSFLYIRRYTDLFRHSRRRISLSEFRKMVLYGIPDASYVFMTAIQDYFMVKILLSAFGVEGGVISGVCDFCSGLASIFIRTTQNSARPLMGLFAGADDRMDLKLLMRHALNVIVASVGIVVLTVQAFPAFFYRIYHVTEIPDGGLLSLRLFAPFLLIKGCSTLFRMYLNNRGDSGYAARVTIFGTATLPFFAWTLSLLAGGPYLWLAYSFSELLMLMIYYMRYLRRKRIDRENESLDHSLFLSVGPASAADASERVMRYLRETGIDDRLSYHIALCLEETGAYAQHANKNKSVEVCVRLKITPEGEAILIILDDGKCVYLNNDEEEKRLITDNYSLIRRISRRFEYQYVLNLNQIKIVL